MAMHLPIHYSMTATSPSWAPQLQLASLYAAEGQRSVHKEPATRTVDSPQPQDNSEMVQAPWRQCIASIKGKAA